MILNEKSNNELSSFTIIYRGSVCNETVGIRGIAHLGEHLMCKGIQKFQDQLENDGIKWNAFTSNNDIVFYISGLEKYLKKWREPFLEALNNFEIDQAEFEKEKKIVIQEYLGSINSQESAHFMNFERKYINNYQPIGSLEDLKKMTYLDMMNFYEKQYMNPSMIINISEKLTYKDKVQPFASNKFDNKYTIKTEGYDYEHIAFPGLANSQNSSIIIASPFLEDGNPAYMSSVINNILSGGLNSPLYQEIREKRSLVYGLGISTRRINNQGIIYFNASAESENVAEIIKQFGEVIKSGDKAITPERFKIVLNKMKISLEESELYKASQSSRYYNKPEYNLYDKIDSITYDKLMDYYKEFYVDNFDKWIISIDKEDFGTNAQ